MLGKVVVDASLRMFQISGEFAPLGQGIIDGFCQGGVGADDLAVFLQLFMDVIQDGAALLVTRCQDFLGLLRQ